MSPVAAACVVDVTGALADAATGTAFAVEALEGAVLVPGVDATAGVEPSGGQLPARLYPAASASSTLLKKTRFFSAMSR